MNNTLKTIIFLATLTALALAIGSIFGPSGMIIAGVIVLVINFISYFFSDKIALKMYNAKPSANTRLNRLVEQTAQQGKMHTPKIYLIQSPTPNAFATGRNQKNSSVAFTTGILDLLTDRELKGVIAHELAHIKNRDILISTITAVVAGVISYFANMMQWAAIFGGFGSEDGPNIIELLALIILTPLIATILRLAVSRAREYQADKIGAEMIHDPYSLASALEKLEYGVQKKPLRNAPEGTEGLFIVNPFRASAAAALFSTHPPTKKRVEKLRKMKL